MSTMAQMAQDTASAAKQRAVAKLRQQAHTQLEIQARAFLDGDYELALQANTNARPFLLSLAENTKGVS
jgi:hypothetical protein